MKTALFFFLIATIGCSTPGKKQIDSIRIPAQENLNFPKNLKALALAFSSTADNNICKIATQEENLTFGNEIFPMLKVIITTNDRPSSYRFSIIQEPKVKYKRFLNSKDEQVKRVSIEYYVDLLDMFMYEPEEIIVTVNEGHQIKSIKVIDEGTLSLNGKSTPPKVRILCKWD